MNYIPRKKYQGPKIPAIETQEQRIDRAITMIRVKGDISEYSLQKILQWGPGVNERIMRLIKNNYQDVVEWNKKTRMWKYIEITVEEKPKLSNPELEIINTIKQESR